MSLSWLRRNWADTDEGIDPALAPIDLPQPRPVALENVRRAIGTLPRWQIEEVDAEAGLLCASRRTRLFRFVDDITIRLEALSAETTRVHVRSKSRVGKGDLGQNRRNILELFAKLHT